jgi:hypothetical protein
MPVFRVSSHASVAANAGPLLGHRDSSGVQWYDPTNRAALISGAIPPQTWAALYKLTDGGFALDVHSVATQVGPINFTSATTPAAAAALINTALTVANGTCESVAPGVVLTSSLNATPALSFARAPAAGTDISAMLSLTSATGASRRP